MSMNTVLLAYAPEVKTKGDPQGRKLFVVTFMTRYNDKENSMTASSELWRGYNSKEVKEAASKEISEIVDHMIDGDTKISQIFEVGVLK